MATHQLPQLASTLKTPGSEEASIESKTEVVELEGKTDEQVRASFTYEQEQRLLRKVSFVAELLSAPVSSTSVLQLSWSALPYALICVLLNR